MAMGYLDNCAGMIRAIGSLRGQGYRGYGDYLRCGGALDCFSIVVAIGACIGSCWLLYNRLLYRGYVVHRYMSVGNQEKLYPAVTEGCSTLAVCNYDDSWHAPI